MKAALLLGLWLAIGLAVAGRDRRPPIERALAVLFWPFFLGRVDRAGPLERLAEALGPGDAAAALVASLAAAFARLEARLRRVDDALARTDNDRSRQLLLAARDRLRAELHEARAAVDEAATRLTLMAEDHERGEIEALLRALSSRLMAGEELGAQPRPGA